MSCPGPREVLALVEGVELPDVAAHCENCADCGGLLADLRDFPNIEPAEGVLPPSVEEMAVDQDALRLQSDGHLTPRLLEAFVEGNIGSVSQELVMEHIAVCDKCGDAVFDAAEADASWQEFNKAKYGADLGFEGGGAATE